MVQVIFSRFFELLLHFLLTKTVFRICFSFDFLVLHFCIASGAPLSFTSVS